MRRVAGPLREGVSGSEMTLGIPTHGVLMVTYHYPPSMEMGGQTCAQIARHLPLYGWSPTVLTVRECYSELVGDALEQDSPGRVVRAGMLPHPLTLYRILKSRLHWGHNSAGGGGKDSENRGRLRRWLLSLLLVGDGYTGWLLPAGLAGLRVARGAGVQHLLSSGPPWTSHLVGLLLSRITGLPWTAHFRDPWIQGSQSKPLSLVSMRIDTALERIVMKRATSVVCVTDRHTEILKRAYSDLAPGKFVTIPNGFDGEEWESIEAESDLDSELATEFTITYTGQLYHARNPRPLFQALRILIDAGHIDQNRIRVELIGWCDLAEGRQVSDIAEDFRMRDCITMRGPLARREALRALTRSNLLLLLAEGMTLQIPGKTYEYLRAGRPILALTADGALTDLLRSTGGASVVAPHDVAGIAAVVREAYQNWKAGYPRGATKVSISQFDRRILAGRFAELFTRSVSPTDVASALR